MGKAYQNEEIERSRPAVPERVSVALAELTGELREGLLALAVGAGLQVLAALMEADVTAACGPRGRHDPQRSVTRHGHGAGSVTLGGRRVPVERPRMRATNGSSEVAVPSYELFSQTEVLDRLAMERMLAGLSTRRYPVGLEPVGARTTQTATATSKSAVSRRFVAATETALAELLAADLAALDLVALMVDGVHFGEHCCVVALGIDGDGDGAKHPLALVEGSTENATLVTELIVGLMRCKRETFRSARECHLGNSVQLRNQCELLVPRRRIGEAIETSGMAQVAPEKAARRRLVRHSGSERSRVHSVVRHPRHRGATRSRHHALRNRAPAAQRP